MIVFDKLWQTMQQRGVSTYKLRNTYGMDTNTIKRLRLNQNVTTETLNKLCCILRCDLEDIAQYIKDEKMSGADKAFLCF